MTTTTFVLCVALLCLAGAVAARSTPKYPFPAELLGTWLGSCQQHAFSPNGSQVHCATSRVLITYPYMVHYEAMKMGDKWGLMSSFNQSAVAIMTNNRTYMNAAIVVPGSITEVYPADCGGNNWCMSTYAGKMDVAYMASVNKMGSSLVYTEQGEYDTKTNMLLPTCPATDHPKLFCRSTTYNYICTAYRISSK